jgi:nicotinamide-nucleotide amidase
MASAEIITIGTEILLGEIVDTNAAYIARFLRGLGVDLYRKTTVGDNPERIAKVVRSALERADFVITTGGLGPTVDDPTREAIALAAGVNSVFREELWEQIRERFERFGRVPTDNNRRQAYIPEGALAVENPVGTAPAFIQEIPPGVVICLPGVPREMEFLLEQAVAPYLKKRFSLTSIIKTRTLHTSGAGESQVDDRISDLEGYSNPTVGLAARAGQVDVRIAVKANSEAEADALLEPLEAEIRGRLGNWVFGVDEDTLEGIVLDALARRNWTLGAVEAGLKGVLLRRFAQTTVGVFAGGELVSAQAASELFERAREFRTAKQVDVLITAGLYPAGQRHDLHVLLISPEGEENLSRSYGGPAALAPIWSVNICLDFLRKLGNSSA